MAGRSNVGKSSLLNRLVGQKKMAKVSSTPGKTRSLNFFLMNDRYYLVDLPGYGYAKVSKSMKKEWQRLIGEYLDKSSTLIGLVLLLDVRREPNDEDHQLMEWLAARGVPVLVAVTKADKVKRGQVIQKVAQIEKEFGLPAIPFSTVSGMGKKELMGSIETLVNDSTHKTEVS